METITIKVDSPENAHFLKELLEKFQFVKTIKTSKEKKMDIKERYKMLPIHWATEEPCVEDFISIVINRKLSLDEIREKAWKRNW